MHLNTHTHAQAYKVPVAVTLFIVFYYSWFLFLVFFSATGNMHNNARTHTDARAGTQSGSYRERNPDRYDRALCNAVDSVCKWLPGIGKFLRQSLLKSQRILIICSKQTVTIEHQKRTEKRFKIFLNWKLRAPASCVADGGSAARDRRSVGVDSAASNMLDSSLLPDVAAACAVTFTLVIWFFLLWHIPLSHIVTVSRLPSSGVAALPALCRSAAAAIATIN